MAFIFDSPAFPDAKTIFCAGLLPVLLVVVAALAGRTWRDDCARWAALPAIGIGAAFMIGMPCLVEGLTIWPPRNGWHWLFWIAAGAAAVGAIELALPRAWLVWVLGAVVSVVAFYLLARIFILRPSRPWSTGDAAMWIGISASAAWLMALSSDLLTRRTGNGRLAAWTLALTALVAAAQIGLRSSQQHAHVAGIAAMCALAIAGLSLLMPYLRFGSAVWLALSLLLTAVTTVNLDPWYASVPLLNGILIFVAPLTAWAALLADPQRRLAPMAVAIIATLAPLSPVIVQVVETAIRMHAQGYL